MNTSGSFSLFPISAEVDRRSERQNRHGQNERLVTHGVGAQQAIPRRLSQVVSSNWPSELTDIPTFPTLRLQFRQEFHQGVLGLPVASRSAATNTGSTHADPVSEDGTFSVCMISTVEHIRLPGKSA